ncbi:carbamoyl-phosphate synthase large subunit [Gordonibacter urolithinfaciens]|uniref:Carbamoyl phosphate synthase large chain n=1 Tax=Gordonibacter urolithinfaciens TaxID=1335613 RepID=A0A6N8IKZ0_9ACTN|nr:carbamoyl-phosphate synthase large subunit [Gordonibacter urolithinfaciens]MVM55919.1 carbamoyl-phosphate synthase large subunit [Gordonibacter urolithinfaciens]MVN16040.1 carbamoyl-phosphate synthase large subunit [Gordonibacter urolithinfaciens]MVN39414.1 carbamoyl-phosphate synthase large subunit [Gordonibacter urolithinfaciens]MVN57296.1 carbamoyl-phosphate synthase large subunit [Gordonibacter urolithinfaciens]MVN62140.1 carbamoyl-phosphate synthase large subunit [Gordonibacter urolith
MPKRTDIDTILVIGSGPIVIGQACEFDYSGAQACKVLKADGYRVVLVNSNPATIMTDPGLADRTYVEPITPEFVEQVIAKERPDALLPTLGGQTGLNTAVDLARAGVLEKYGVEMIGCDLAAIERGEDRKLFNECMAELGIETSRSGYAYSLADAEAIVAELGYPVVLRPSFTLGGAGGGIAHDPAELHEIVGQGLELSPAGEVLVEESIEGWKEYEMEVMRDHAGNGIIVCSIENFDAMGVHTGDSITVAPAQTLSDVEYQRMRAASLAILEKIGVETGGSNVQFAVNPDNGRMIVIEMNPRVSRSSALASKATGFPIAKAAAKLAVGYTLDEIVNDITKATPACFEPSIDYCVVKVPRFAFEKFQGTDDTLSTRMKAVGEVMAIGRTFEEALGKAMRSLENGRAGLGADGKDAGLPDGEAFDDLVARPTADRVFYLAAAQRRGWTVERVCAATGIDPFFIARMADIVRVQENLRGMHLDELDADAFRLLKRMGLSDAQIAHLTGSDELTVRTCRKLLGVRPAFKTVDTCAAEFPSSTAYHYKTYDADETEVAPKTRKRAMILGAGPNRIGQGIEFDYCCVHASYALAEAGFETIMVNCNPETVSTDYDTSDKLYFEPLTFEDVMDIVDVERPDGVVVTLGGQTPLKLANALAEAGVPIMGTSPEAIDLAEDRDRFSAILDEMAITYPAAGMAFTYQEACVVADQIGFPLLVRPSYVLGGRGMGIVYDGAQLEKYMAEAAKISPDHPVYLDRFLEGAVEVDLDALCDGEAVYVGGVLEHIEMAGIHSGDSACCTPPFALSEALVSQLRSVARDLALRLGVVGLINIQFAIKDQVIYIIEANPRASRTVPFVSKATGVPLAKMAARIMAGEKIADLGLPPDDRRLEHYSVKEAVMPFGRFPGADTVLGPEMKSTGEVMGIAGNFPAAFAKTQLAISYALPEGGTVFISVCDRDKRAIVSIARDIVRLGFKVVATGGTARALRAAGVDCEEVKKVHEGAPNVLDRIAAGEIALMINTPFGHATRADGYELRLEAVKHGVTHVTNLAGAQAMVAGMEMARANGLSVVALQDLPQWG